jgi:tape measure domain-containing protein
MEGGYVNVSNTVDRRVVEMEFDNREFEKNIGASLKSIGSLKESLKLEDSAKELKALEKAGRRFNLDGIAEAAEMVTSKFSIMGTIGDQVIRRLTDSVLNVIYKMKNVVNSLTIEPIYSGFQEYETQINAIQTILSNTREELTNKGYDDAARLDLVNSRLDQLNHYADKTIYNFTEMTRNIGTFTAAGVELDTAVNSIQGIANLAAVSGSTSEQASRAMYQLSQAISTGTVRLMDWNSVVNAGMGGKVFQDALVRTAKAMNKTVDVTVTKTNAAGKKITAIEKRTIDELIKETGSFRESLSKGWLTADVLTATLEQFSWDFEQIAEDTILNDENRESWIKRLAEMYVGDGRDADAALEKARKMLEEMTDLTAEEVKEIKKAELLASGYTSDEADEIIKLAEDANEAATKVKTFTQLFDTLKEAAQSGWTQTWEYIIGNFEEAKSTLTGISKFFGAIIDSSSEARNSIVKEWHDRGGRDMLWNDDAEKGPLGAFWNLVLGIKNMISAVREEFQKIFPPATSQTLLNITQGVQGVTARFREWTENSKGMDFIRRIIGGIAAALGMVRDAASYVWKAFLQLFGIGGSAFDGLLEFFAGIGDWIVKTRESIKTSKAFQKFLTKMSSAIATVGKTLTGAAKTVFSWITKLWNKIAESEVLSKASEYVVNFVSSIPDAISNVKEWAKSIIDSVKASNSLQEAWAKVKKFFEPAINSVKSFGERLKSSISNLFNKDVTDGGNFIDRLKASLSGFGDAFTGWYKDLKQKAETAWTSIKNFFSDLFTKKIPNFFNKDEDGTEGVEKNINGINWKKILLIGLGIGTIASVLTLVGTVLRILLNISKIGKIGDAFKLLAKDFKGIGGTIGGAFASISKTGGQLELGWKGMKMTSKGKTPIATTLLKIAAAIGIMVGSVYVLSKMEWKDLLKGMGFVTLLAAELVGISLLFKNLNIDGGSVLKAAAAVLVLAIPIRILAKMELLDALKGISLIGLILAELAGFTKLIGSSGIGKTASFIGLSVAVVVLVHAIKSLGKLDFWTLTKGLGGLEILLLELASFSKKASGGKIAGIIGLAIGINLMVRAVQKMGNFKLSTIIKGVLGIGGLLLAFGTMIKMTKGLNFGTALTLLITLAGSLFLITEAFNRLEVRNPDDILKFAGSFSAIMLSMSVGFALLSKIPIAGALKGVANFAIMIVGIGGIIAGLGWLQSEWKGLTNFLEGGGEVLGQIGRALGKFIGGIAGGIFDGKGINLPQIGTDLSTFMTNSSGFVKGAKNVDSSVVDGVTTLCRALVAVSGTEFLSALVALFTGENPVTKFTTDIKTLGTGLSKYSKSIAGISGKAKTADMTAAGKLADSITTISESIKPDTLGDWLLALFNKKTSFERFVEAIGPLGEGLASYAESIGLIPNSVDTTKPAIAVLAAQGISEIANGVPEVSGWSKMFAWIETDFGMFIQRIKPFGEAMSAYAEATKDFPTKVDDVNVELVTKAATGISKIANGVPEVSGWSKVLGWIETDFGVFIKKIKPFGLAMSAYADAIDDFPTKVDNVNIELVTKAATGISKIANGVPNIGFWENFVPWMATDFTLFTRRIKPFGEAMSAYADAVGDFPEKVDDANITLVNKAAAGISKIANGVPEVDTLDKLTPWLATDFGLFIPGIKPFGQAMSAYADATSDFSEKINVKAASMVIFAATGISKIANDVPELSNWEKLIPWMETDFSSFVSNIKPFGQAMGAYATAIADVPESMDEAKNSLVVTAAAGIADIAKSVPELSDWNKFIPWMETDFSSFISNIKPFGEAMGAYATGIKDVPENIDIQKSDLVITAAAGISDLAKSVPELDNWEKFLPWMESDFSSFISNITPFSEAMAAYATMASNFSTNVTTEDNTSVLNAAQGLVDFANTFDPSGTVWDMLDKAFGKGSKIATLKEYTGAIKQLGDDLGSFATNTTGISEAISANDATAIVTAMQDFVNGLDPSGAVWDWFAEQFGSGSKFATLETLTGQMADLGDKLKTFSSGAATANLASKNFEKVKELILDLKTFTETINEDGQVNAGNMYTLFGVIETAGVSLERMSDSLSGISSVDDLAKAAGVIRDFAYAFEVAGTMSNFDSNPIQTIVDSVSQIMIPKFDEGGIESAQAYISSLLTSIEDASTLLSLTTAITALSSAGSSAADGTYNVWYTSGQYLAAGLGAGISSMADSVKTSATTVASGAIQSIRIAWSIQSPSKVGQELGMYFDMGIAGGLSEYSRIVSDQASEVGMSAVDSASTLLRGVDGSIFDNLDPNPTIRPVVDLTEVQNGVNSINTMFGANRVLSSDLFRGVNSLRGIGTLNMDGAKIAGGLTDKNIVSSINALQNKLDNLGEAISNMQLVLDSGALVGGTSSLMDQALGDISSHKGRAN